jgi:hypothetical protein
MIDLKLNPEAILAMCDGDFCRLDSYEFFLTVATDEDGKEEGVFLTVVGSRIVEYNNLIMQADYGAAYPRYQDFITHLRHPRFSATMSREELIGVVVARNYRIE